MPYRSDPSLWFNLAGVVAAWQPVAAPGPLLARYNQAHGGDNRYKAIDGTAPLWSFARGWQNDDGQKYLATGIVPAAGWSAIVRYSDQASSSFNEMFGCRDGTRFFGYTGNAGGQYYENGGYVNVAGTYTGGVAAVAGVNGYMNGVLTTASIGAWTGSTSASVYICNQNGGTWGPGSPANGFRGYIYAFLLVQRVLSPAEVWQASRQMAHCHVNPDWSAWGRRRRYYYAPSEAAAGLAFSPVGSGVIGSSVVRSVQ